MRQLFAPGADAILRLVAFSLVGVILAASVARTPDVPVPALPSVT